MEAFGGKGFFVDDPQQVEGNKSPTTTCPNFGITFLLATVKEALATPSPTLVNVLIDPSGPTPAIVAQDKTIH